MAWLGLAWHGAAMAEEATTDRLPPVGAVPETAAAPLPVLPRLGIESLRPMVADGTGMAGRRGAIGQHGAELRAQLRPRRQALLAAPRNAALIEFPYRDGDRVEEGQRIARFDCREEAAARRLAVAEAAAAGARVQANERLLSLGSGSELELSLARAARSAAQAEIERMDAILLKCDIAAPFDAAVVRRHADAFQYLREGDPLIELVDVSDLEVEMVLPAAWVPRLREGPRFELVIGSTGAVAEGRVERLIGLVDPVSQTLRVIGHLLEADESLLPGMSGSVRFPEPMAPWMGGSGEVGPAGGGR